MFRSAIPLTLPFTNDLRKNSPSFTEISSDYSLFMTATVLLHNRVENLKLESSITRDRIDDIPFNSDPEVYSFHWIHFNSNVANHNIEDSIKAFDNRYTGFETFPAVEKFIKDRLEQTVYVRIFPKENAVVLFIEKLSTELWHLMQSFISRYFEIFKTKPLTEKELDFVRSLTLRGPSNYLQYLDELTDTEEFRRYSLKIQLDRFEKQVFERKLESAKNDIARVQGEIDRLMTQYRDAIAKQLEAKIRYEGLQVMTENTEEKTELQEYLIDNKNLTKVAINGSSITFVVKTYLIPYLMDSWDSMSKRGEIFKGFSGEFKDPANAKLLLDAIFSYDHTLKLRMCAYINLDYLMCTVKSGSNYDYSNIKDYIPNPHLFYHNCFGQNGPDILDQINMGDPIGAIECAINCVKHVNIDEWSMTFKPFLNNLMKFNGKCIVTEDGQEMTVTEALHYLKGIKDEADTPEQRNEAEAAE